MDYGRLHSKLPASQSPLHPNFHQPPPTRTRRKLILLSFLSIILIAASAVSATLFLRMRQPGGPHSSSLHRHPTQAISKACATTRYPNLCLNSLLAVPGATAASQTDLVHISFNLTLQKFGRALVSTSDLATLHMDQRVRSAYDDCLELLDDSVDALTRSLLSVSPSKNQRPASTSDVMTWLSTALTNHDTCTEGFSTVAGPVKTQMLQHLTDLAELVSNCLAIFSASNSDDFAGVPIQNKRRLLADRKFPAWMGNRERRLLDLPVSALRPDIVVSQDGNGTVKTIAEAIKKAPEYSTRRTVIYIKAGT